MSNLPHPFDAPDYRGLIFMAEYSVCSQATQVWIARREYEPPYSSGVTTSIARLAWETVEPNDQLPAPTIVCSDRESYNGTNQLQFLFDALWQLGFRPKKSDPSGEVLAAKDQNLADLRTILFNQLGIE
jgi:hypothetical protein